MSIKTLLIGLVFLATKAAANEDANGPSGTPDYTIKPIVHKDLLPSKGPIPGFVQGMANNMSISKAFKILVPGDYNIIYDTELDTETLISYRGGRHWTEVIREIEENYELRIIIESRTVFVSTPTVALVTDNPEIKKLATEKKPSPEAIYHEKMNSRVEKRMIFMARAGDRVEDLLKSWAEAAGWNVVYNSKVHYYVEVNERFVGTFVDNAVRVINSFNNGEFRMHANFDEVRRRLVIQDVAYKPSPDRNRVVSSQWRSVNAQ